MKKEVVVSGMRSTNKLHLGNYFGALVNFVKLQEEYDCYLFIADWHALTTHPDPAELKPNVYGVLANYLAGGLDPDKCTIYAQSHLKQISELYLLFNMLAYKGELERTTTFKEKARQHPDNVNAGLLTYPVLMAVDILIHRALKVPVGKDQIQNIEMCRNFAERFNSRYNTELFPLPEGFNFGEDLVKVPALDASGKMSKSGPAGNAIYLDDSDDEIQKKVMKAVTDVGPTTENAPKPEAIQNLFDLMQLVSTADVIQHYDSTWNNCSIRYGDMKKQLAEDMKTFVRPLREKIQSYSEQDLQRILHQGAEKAAISAEATITQVRSLMGLDY